MTTYQLNKVLYRIKHDRRYRRLFLIDFQRALEGFELTPGEIRALRARDCAKLVKLGAKPMLLLPFAGIAGQGDLFTVDKDHS